jgi:Tfp pilus assembly protein PilF
MEMIHLARQQIEAQKTASREIAKSNLMGAQIIATEIEHQAYALDRTINQVGDKICGSITLAADQISDAIDMLGDRLCVELSEIKWQLTQQNKTLEKILEVLYQSRNNEAKQLVQQGLRHYVNDEFEEAEERLKLALSFDTTDYQVLMNLSFIEIHKENPSQAFSFFKKALSLPDSLDSVSKARTLWATARLYYAERDFNQAYTYAEEAFKHDSQNDPHVFYNLGVYAALAGKKSVALEKIEQSILIDPSYFSRCSVDPDLQTIKQDILQILSRLSTNAESKANQMVEAIKNDLSILETEGKSYSKDNFTEEIRKIVNNAVVELKNPSYSFCLRCANVMNTIQGIVSQIKNLIPLYSKQSKFQEDFDKKNKIYSSVKQQPEPERDFPPAVYTIMFIISYILPGYFLANGGSAEEGIPWLLLFVIWPLWFVLGLLGALVGRTAMSGGGFKGLVVVGIMWGVAVLIRKLMEKNHDAKNRERASVRQQFDEAQKAFNNIQNEIYLKQNTIREQLSNVRL